MTSLSTVFCRRKCTTCLRGQYNLHLMMREYNHWWFKTYTGKGSRKRKTVWEVKNGGLKMYTVYIFTMTRILDNQSIFLFFMYLWYVINSCRLDREITPCLPENKPRPVVSSPSVYYSQDSVMSRSKRLHSHGQG